jgi:hypothetical protein
VTYILFAGCDVRVDPELPDVAWDKKRRELFLIRPEVTRPLSVDPWVWPKPRPVAGEPVGCPLPWVSVDDVRRRWASQEGRDGWVSIAIGAVAADSHARELLAKGRGIKTEVMAGSQWRFLGYDIADASDISGLSNCGYEGWALESLRQTWAPRLNTHGLFSEVSDAVSFRSVTDHRVPEHAPFQVYGIWLVP